ncbi:hypothetical protein [Changchengzhania lutea]|uniref:hypothetical protein n=1 Tax=Changchengzhania lutea TaxID=2049305 RepID=UPI00115DCF03|nr:hypothetical protein [Changchengzhania lutea]
MKKDSISYINIKISISLIRLLELSKKFKPYKNTKEEIAISYNEIALEADIRKATVSDTFNAKSKSGPNYTTVILIIESMGFKLVDFAKIYDSLTEIDIENFKKNN